MNSLSSMSTSCLQNREASSYYPMFHHEALSSLSSYGRSCGVSSQSSAINSHMPSSYGSSLSSPSSGSGSAAAGMHHPREQRIYVKNKKCCGRHTGPVLHHRQVIFTHC